MNLSQVFGSFINQVKGNVTQDGFTLTGGVTPKTLTIDETVEVSTMLQNIQTASENTGVSTFYTVRRR